MKPISDQIKEKPWLGWLIFFATIVVVFILGLFASSIVERRAEAQFTYTPQVEHSQYEPRNEVWGENFPRQYQTYMQTSDTTFESKYNGAKRIDMLAKYPEFVILWADYGFAKEYNQGRGHYHAIDDIREILRTGAPIDGKESPMPNTCWTCKSPDVPRLMSEIGPAEFYRGTWEEKGHEIVNPIGCADCHDAETMNLRISRPALIEAFERQGKDITMASHQEMRSLVCAQCHVEYYFNKDKVEGVQYLTFPWDNGFAIEDMEKYYDGMEFSDWTHGLSRAPMLKAQHPDYEVYSTGIHASRGVSCADCHMPYMNEGGQKFTDHHIQSPLNNVANSCQVCHRDETEELVATVYKRQDQIAHNREKLEELLVRAHVEAKHAWDFGATEEQMEDILMDIRHAQWRWDFSAAGHGNSFHNPVELGRIIGDGISIAQESRIKLARVLASLGHNEAIEYPDISTKAKAQAYLGMDMATLNQEKETFLNTVVPQWLEKAKEREANYPVQIN
ncbi:ammonia-forming cytochrome c nitrite reductase [Marinilabilia salmonicolor]|jgi:nitrite reductase (cytochrome c-552)|uniref:nitrite reductase (cytochrome; ammonia-forming) n=1 Tax=Marinilabilia salmonicolor TaxID=989 RepID=A0A2T0WXD8_9BACT|nr:ammonia-forming cytochrome c nitrite reductase [Marinilabilia salmonicolor]PRY91327.1 nitrite reductase (cytochrome c-552) [Marinilabilia salmonicolor]RCW30177.1 nitrite reductase (cytochrome c-552) [Marinilabilia salmonicolor]